MTQPSFVAGEAARLAGIREKCRTRGYHRIEADKPPAGEDTEIYKNWRFCYDCESVFERGMTPYRIVPA
jgi:hypothetical protein